MRFNHRINPEYTEGMQKQMVESTAKYAKKIRMQMDAKENKLTLGF